MLEALNIQNKPLMNHLHPLINHKLIYIDVNIFRKSFCMKKNSLNT